MVSPRISLIVPTLNRARLLRQTLESLVAQQGAEGEYEILVIDNGSTDGTAEVVLELQRRHRGAELYYLYESVPGLLSGRHRGAIAARGEILHFLDDDIIADPLLVASVARDFTADVSLACGPSLPKFEVEPGHEVLSLFTHGPDIVQCGAISCGYYGASPKRIDPNLAWGLNFIIRRSVLWELGGFHPDSMPQALQAYQGDGETGLSLKARNMGLQAAYLPTASVLHVIPKDRLTRSSLGKRWFYQGVCDSYTDVREAGAPGVSTSRNLHSPHDSSFTSFLQRAYVSGYQFHQSRVSTSRTLHSWVVRERYDDYALPRLESGISTGPTPDELKTWT